MERQLFTPEETADILSVGRTRVYQLIQQGSLESIKIGRSRRISRAALALYLDWITNSVDR